MFPFVVGGSVGEQDLRPWSRFLPAAGSISYPERSSGPRLPGCESSAEASLWLRGLRRSVPDAAISLDHGLDSACVSQVLPALT
jgi:hypothetical protein